MNQPGIDIQGNDTICAPATPPGVSAIAVIRVSGEKAIQISDTLFKSKKTKSNLKNAKSHTVHFGDITDNSDIVDEVLVTVFKSPHSYTGEDSVEISCHGSPYIIKSIIELLVRKGCRYAKPGEFTMRAFLNGKFDLSQAEAVADLIASQSKTSHDLALNQMRGGFSSKIKELRKKLLNFTALIELELDFSEEDVEFANRNELKNLLKNLKTEVSKLVDSFKLGNVIKLGIPVAIIGKPNVGKSTLLNAILNEEKAIVSEIPGTTRDTIEDSISINGTTFRFIDTAGLRKSGDQIEKIGIERTYEKIKQSKIILYIFDVSSTTCDEVEEALNEFKDYLNELPEGQSRSKEFILIANKTDMLVEAPKGFRSLVEHDCIFVSAKRKENINLIIDRLSEYVENEKVTDTAIVSNNRHYEALLKASEAIENIETGFKQELTSDLVVTDIRDALYHLGDITGEITTDEVLGNIFSRFCIGK
jgi:tRNA modification GTPase